MRQNHLVCFPAMHSICTLFTSLKLLIPPFMSTMAILEFQTHFLHKNFFCCFCFIGTFPEAFPKSITGSLHGLNLLTLEGCVLKLTNSPLLNFRFYSFHPTPSELNLVHPVLALDCNNNPQILTHLYKSCSPHGKLHKINISHFTYGDTRVKRIKELVQGHILNDRLVSSKTHVLIGAGKKKINCKCRWTVSWLLSIIF